MVLDGIETTKETCIKSIKTLCANDGTTREGIIFYDTREGIMHGWGFTTHHRSTAFQLSRNANREVHYYKCTKSGRFTIEQVK